MKNTSKKLTALILALVLTLSLALAAPAASAATEEIAATAAQGDNFNNPKSIAFGQAESVILTEDQAFYYSFTLPYTGVVTLTPSFVCSDAHSFTFSVMNASNQKKAASKIIYANEKRTVDFYLNQGSYILSVHKNSGADYDTVTTKLTLPLISGLKVSSVTTNSVALSWNKDAKASGYQIFQDTGKGWKHLAFRASANNSYTVGSLVRGKSYRFAVRPYYDKDDRYYGNRVAVTAKTPYTVKTPALPTLKNTKSGVKITFTRVAGAAKYRIFRKEGKGIWKSLTNTTSNAFTDKTAKNGRTYSYTIQCITADGKAYTSGFNKTGRTIKCKR